MATDTAGDGYSNSRQIGRKTQVTLRDDQYERLRKERRRTGLSQSALVRRALDIVYGDGPITVKGVEVSLGIWRSPDAGAVGRRDHWLPGWLRRK
jgi:predicted dithiol-disulfide oxidoreductase (DUF899 family)